MNLFSLASYNPNVKLVSESSTWGINDAGVKNETINSMKDYFNSSDQSYTADDFNATNDKLNAYSADEMGAQQLLDDAVSHNQITTLQHDLFIMHYTIMALVTYCSDYIE